MLNNLDVKVKLTLINSLIDQGNIKIGDIIEVCLSLVGNRKDNSTRWIGYDAEFITNL